MKTWTRAQDDSKCGDCDHTFRRGDPVLEIQIAGVTRRKLRCQTCAGEAPPDLPVLIERSTAVQHAFTSAGSGDAVAAWVALDWKRARSGDREPGDEGDV